ncbi:TIGR02221 family CRISPR-associated protein [Sphaerospermopsis sp. LEGE 08334]|uniref:TIGR02221 family CRISPR-associated protein n=1 Tax=Sphaerospermopsis sp. LEGE 08334 TaxID=1828651 RepID=UPI001882D7EB|nr:TIGR02221 family CRISPR-associated protein [Sphaerospermopsis sp. LEGE 08334]MBE9055640.1 TIGR02221 family CRISPR-associated protein [Sphaerospermopsis sp. LEGE 08334]
MSKINIITFLGDRGALQTTYTHNGNEYIGGVFAEALRQFCDYDTMLVCVTERARENTWPVLEALGDSRIKPIDIPTGRSTEEMWQTFKIIAEQVNENDHVIFDITHGLRSLPFLVFLFAAYLKAAKNVTIDAIYYGALELGNFKTGIPAPVIDLSEFIGMLDWLTATERFVEMGDGQALANLLRNAIPSGIELRDNPASRPIRSHLERTANSIENISLALSLTRPIETMQSATRLEEILKQAESSFAERAKPFSLLSERVVKEYGQFALEDPTDQAALAENLWLQLQMIEWYIKRDRVVQAVTLAREWLISVLVLRFGELMFDNHNGRKYVENAINNAVEKTKKDPRPITPSRCDDKFTTLSQADELVTVWNQMTQLRNDIAHVGMNLNPQPAFRLKEKAVSLYPLLQKLGQELLPERVKI